MNWTSQQEVIVKIENRFIPILTKRIRAIFRQGLELYRQGRINDLYTIPVDPELIGIIQKMYQVSGMTMARYVYKNMPTVRQLEKKATGRMGVSLQWLTVIREFLAAFGLEMAVEITGTLQKDLIKILTYGEEQGWGYERMAREIMGAGIRLPGIRNWTPFQRARVIARTEVHRGAMVGSMQGANSLPYEVQKEWIAANDKRVRRVPKDRFDHRELNGQVRELNEPFKNQEEIMFPGDPKASAANTIQCRCVTGYIPKRDARGRLIMKNT